MTIKVANYLPFSYRPILEDDCMDDENDFMDEDDVGDWWKNEDEQGEDEYE